MTAALVCDAVRTPIGRYGGALAGIRPDDLAAIVIREVIARAGLPPKAVDEVFLGCANQSGEDNRNVARMALLLAGLPVEVPGVTVNRLCASGADAVGAAARAILAGEINVAVAGGVESMSRAPYVLGKAACMGDRGQQLEDTVIGWRLVNPEMSRRYGIDPMPRTAENVAETLSVSRADQDALALSSQLRCAHAARIGYHAREIVAVEIADGEVFEHDEHPRPSTTAEALASLKSVVGPQGTVTAGNSSGVNDGAAALLIASPIAVDLHGLRPRARILGMGTAGVEPRLMGMGPVPAIARLLDRLELTLGQFDLIEINEAFASQVVACARGIGIDPLDTGLNPNGGAIALGHPLGMSGARLVQTAVNALEVGGGRRALVAMCVGVGQGVAIAVERID